jgi:hypothetical protein
VLIGIGFSIMGPLPFFNMEKSIKLIIVALVFHGLGLGAEVVAGFADAHKSVRICQKFKIELKSLNGFQNIFSIFLFIHLYVFLFSFFN